MGDYGIWLFSLFGSFAFAMILLGRTPPGRMFVYGVFFEKTTRMAWQDFIGLEQFLEVAETNWREVSFLLPLAFAIAFGALGLSVYSEYRAEQRRIRESGPQKEINLKYRRK